MSHDVFVSYSSHDRLVADAICGTLEAAGVSCWIAPRDILPGDTWGGAIMRAISETAVMILVFSGRANTSPQILREVERAVSREVVIIPIRIEDIQPVDGLEYFISSHQWFDALPPPLEQHLDRITSVVKRVIASRRRTGEVRSSARGTTHDSSHPSVTTSSTGAHDAATTVRNPFEVVASSPDSPGRTHQRFPFDTAASAGDSGPRGHSSEPDFLLDAHLRPPTRPTRPIRRGFLARMLADALLSARSEPVLPAILLLVGLVVLLGLLLDLVGSP